MVAIENLRLACDFGFTGIPYDCDENVVAADDAQATYGALPTAAGLLGVSPTQGVILRLESGGKTIFRRSIAEQVWAAMYGGWVFNAIYWPIAALIVWRWPNSTFSRRVKWEESKS